MRLTFELIVSGVAVFLAYCFVGLKDEYTALVAASANIQWCNIEFEGNTADKPCKIIGPELAEVSFNHE